MIGALTSLLLATAPAELRMPSVFSDHMVVQRDATAKFWGWGQPGQKVSVKATWAKKEYESVVGADGRWSVGVPTKMFGGPYKVTVTSGKKLEFNDVLIGDVWICSGQSNMEWAMSQTDHATEDIAAAKNSRIRLFQVENVMQQTPQLDCNGSWQVCSPDSVKNFSAVAYFFGKEINSQTKVPIGLVDTTWGGTEAELWTSEPGLSRLPDFSAKIKSKATAVQNAQKLHADWERAVMSADQGYAAYTNPTFDDSLWTKTQPVAWSSVEDLKNFDGSCWYRASFNAPANWAGKRVNIQLGVIDDDEETWVNGLKVGATRGFQTPRRYEIPEGIVKAGVNTVTVRVWDPMVEGGWSTPPHQCNVYLGDQLTSITDWRYKKGVAKSELPTEPVANVPNNSLLFNGMINPLLGCPIKGAIWYQGEANVGRAFQYRSLFPAMIQDWRKNWGIEFPFYFVQIAPFNGYGSAAAAELREAQNEALKLKKTGVVVVTDVTGNLDDIHPKDKRTPGHRLALWALTHDYGQAGIEYSGPLFKTMDVEDAKARLTFSHSKGLTAKGGALKEFQVAGSDRVFYPAQAVIEGDTVVVSAPQVGRPAAVRMGWSTAPQPNLFNSAGLPASPFRTDNWPGLTDNAKW